MAWLRLSDFARLPSRKIRLDHWRFAVEEARDERCGLVSETGERRSVIRLFSVLVLLRDPEILGQDAANIASTVQDAENLDTVWNGPVEDEVSLETGKGRDAEVGKCRVVGLVSGAGARHGRQPFECRMSVAKEPDSAFRSALELNVSGDLVQVAEG
jgi:hypothetical protein